MSKSLDFMLKLIAAHFLKEYNHCYLCEFPLEGKEMNSPDKPTHECSRLDFVIRKEYQFLKNVMTREKITSSNHLCSLEAYYEGLTFIFKAYKFLNRQAEYPVTFNESTLNVEYKRFLVEYMADCSTADHIHKQIKEFKIYRSKNATPKQKAFALMYSQYIDFPGDFRTKKRFVSPSFFSDLSNVFFDSFKMIHHSHVTREIYGYAHNVCNKMVRELTEKRRQYFSCVFHNGFRFDMTFLTKTFWLSLWETQDFSLLGSGLTTLRSYTLGRHVKFIDSVKFYQQPLVKLARTADANEKKRIRSLFLDYLAYTHPYYSKFLLDIEEENIEFTLEYLSSGKGCYP